MAAPAERRSVGVGSGWSGAVCATVLGLGTVFGWLSLAHAPALDPVIVAVLWLNLTIVLAGLALELGRRPYSLHLLHLIAMFLFLGAASLYQYSVGRFGVAGPITGVRGQIDTAALAVTLWLIGYLVTYEAQRLLRSRARPGAVLRFLEREITSLRALVVSAFAALTLVYLAAAGLAGVGTRGAASEALEQHALQSGAGELTSAYQIIHANLLRAFPLVALLAVLVVLARGPRGLRAPLLFGASFVLGIGTLLANNPFAAPRFWLTATLFGFSAPFLLRRFRTGSAVLLISLGGLAILPALGDARHALEFDELVDYFELASPVEYIARNPDVDSLGMTALCQMWVDRKGHRWGMQIAGALLSWFPRKFWPGKPIGTGAMVTRDLGFDFTNLSPPLPAEPLVDFGLLGVPVVASIFALLLGRLDAIYWAHGREALGSSRRVIDVIYPFWLMCAVYFTRGDLFAALTQTAGFTFWILALGVGARATTFRAPRG